MLDDSINFVIYELNTTENILAKDLNQQKHYRTYKRGRTVKDLNGQ